MNFKFGFLKEDDFVTFKYDNSYNLQQTSGPKRLCISTSDNYLDLIIDLAKCVQGPFLILYVLHTSRRGNEVARYQSEVLDLDGVKRFFSCFTEFLQNDGRHDVWLHSRDGLTIVYDFHNLIYAYGNLEDYCRLLKDKGFNENPISIPCPHQHNYNPIYDDCEDKVLDYFEWIKSPLGEHDG